MDAGSRGGYDSNHRGAAGRDHKEHLVQTPTLEQ